MSDILAQYRDDGALAGALTRRTRPPGRHKLAWLVPAALRAGEYCLITWLGWRAGTGSLPVTFLLLAALAFHHYDIVYRLRHQGIGPPRWVALAGLGWEGRLVVLLAAWIAGVYVPVALALATWCIAFFVTESVTSWVRVVRDPEGRLALSADDEG